MKCNCEKLIKSLREYKTPEAYLSNERLIELTTTVMVPNLELFSIDFSKISNEDIELLRNSTTLLKKSFAIYEKLGATLKEIPRQACEVDFI